jgi:hypothetical protein
MLIVSSSLCEVTSVQIDISKESNISLIRDSVEIISVKVRNLKVAEGKCSGAQLGD